jgi:hypothetical protein
MITITEPIILIDDLEKILNISKFTLYKRIRNNQFPTGIRYNGKRWFRLTDLQKYYDDLGIKVNIELPSN